MILKRDPRSGCMTQTQTCLKKTAQIAKLRSIVAALILPIAVSGLNAPLVLAQTPDSKPVNLAFNKPAAQTSTRQNDTPHDSQASKAVDGHTDGRFYAESLAITNRQDHPSWWVDLLGNHPIGQIVIYGRNDYKTYLYDDALHNFTVYVRDQHWNIIQRYEHLGLAENDIYTIHCDAGVMGRFVQIEYNSTGVLALAEVEVYSANAAH